MSLGDDVQETSMFPEKKRQLGLQAPYELLACCRLLLDNISINSGAHDKQIT